MINSLFGGEYNALERRSATGNPGKMERINVNLEPENIERLDKVCEHMNTNRGQVVRLIFSGVENQTDLYFIWGSYFMRQTFCLTVMLFDLSVSSRF